jgi:hypothetical protein
VFLDDCIDSGFGDVKLITVFASHLLMPWNPIDFGGDGETDERERKAQKGLTKLYLK